MYQLKARCINVYTQYINEYMLTYMHSLSMNTCIIISLKKIHNIFQVYAKHNDNCPIKSEKVVKSPPPKL